MSDVIEQIDKGIMVEITDVKQALSADKSVCGVLIREFDLDFIEDVMDAISLPVIASCRVGHFVEARILEKTGVAMIDESTRSTMPHMGKKEFSTPFMCRVETLEEIAKRSEEGASAVRTEFNTIDAVAGFVKEAKEAYPSMRMCASLTTATPADVALLFQIGCDTIIISSEIFSSPNPPKLMDALVKTARYYNDMEKIALFSKSVTRA
ncbi:MAG TPA: hypothetical protein ENG06_00410 [Thermoplasmatales archaeon]|nr:MAG: hypothetical protein FE046_00970 [Thermoplasmata archaeon]HDN50218.1 hypothetical protein [Thermoplasmatales archaeon]